MLPLESQVELAQHEATKPFNELLNLVLVAFFLVVDQKCVLEYSAYLVATLACFEHLLDNQVDKQADRLVHTVPLHHFQEVQRQRALSEQLPEYLRQVQDLPHLEAA